MITTLICSICKKLSVTIVKEGPSSQRYNLCGECQRSRIELIYIQKLRALK